MSKICLILLHIKTTIVNLNIPFTVSVTAITPVKSQKCANEMNVPLRRSPRKRSAPDTGDSDTSSPNKPRAAKKRPVKRKHSSEIASSAKQRCLRRKSKK